MHQRRRRKCRHCGDWFRPDPRKVRQQRYCSKAGCRKASKGASQRRWLSKRENQDYFRGPMHVARVQAWRHTHPGYWRRGGAKRSPALQEDSLRQGIEQQREYKLFAAPALQEVLNLQPLVLIGLIAHLTGDTLQDEIAETARRLLRLGGDILKAQGGRNACQTFALPGAGAPNSTPVQPG